MSLYFSGTAQKDKQIIVAPYMSRATNLNVTQFFVQLLKKNLPAHESKYFLLAKWCNICLISGELQEKSHELNHQVELQVDFN